MTVVILNPKISRTLPDPLPGVKHHILLVRACDLPKDIPLDPNPRVQNINRNIYKNVQESLENADDPTFHLKNKGITMVASRVKGDKTPLTITLNDGDGIMDGGHTYSIIQDSINNNTCPKQQYVKIEIITGLNADEVLDIAGGLNTAVQVQKASLMNLEGKFEWIKEAIAGEPYSDKICYKQNERNEFNSREIVGILHALIGDNTMYSYTNKAECLNSFGANEDKYKRTKNILKDILYLYDYVSLKAREQYNKIKKSNGEKGKAGGMKGVYEKKKKGNYTFHFAGEKSEFRLHKGTLYPMLSAMSALMEEKNGQYCWKLGSFENVKNFFKQVAPDMVEATQQLSLSNGRNPNAIGKNQNHWKSLYNIVALAYERQALADQKQMVAALQKQLKTSKRSKTAKRAKTAKHCS